MLESFVGGLWVAELPPEKNGISLRIELRFAWAENKEGVRFDSSFIKGDKRAPYTSGSYAWNPAQEKLLFFYTDSSGGLAEGHITQEGNVLVHDFTISKKDRTVDTARVRLTKVSADVFTNEIFVRRNGAWAKVVEVRYLRHQTDPLPKERCEAKRFYEPTTKPEVGERTGESMAPDR